MEKSISDNVKGNEISVDVTKILKERGYEIAGCTGMKQSQPDKDYVGILKPRENIIKQRFFGFPKSVPQRALYLGTLWFKNSSRHAVYNKNWVLEVNGKDNVPALTELVNELAAPYNVQVRVALTHEKPLFELTMKDLEDAYESQRPFF